MGFHGVGLAVLGLRCRLRGPWRRHGDGRLSAPGRAGRGRDVYLLSALPLFCAALMLAYAWYSVSFYLHRYLAPTAAVTTILVAVLAAGVVQAVRERSAATRLVLAAAAGASVVAVVIPMSLNLSRVERLEHTRGNTYDELTGLYAPSGAALAHLPPGATVGSHQSGALVYIADRHFRVVNLDGVVNPPAFQAIRARHLRRLPASPSY